MSVVLHKTRFMAYKHSNGKNRIEVWLDDAQLEKLLKCAKKDIKTDKPKTYIEYLIKSRIEITATKKV